MAMRTLLASPVSDVAFVQGESLRVDGRDGRLLWADLTRGTIALAPPRGVGEQLDIERFELGRRVGMVAPRASGGWVVAAGRAPCPLCGEPLGAAGHVCIRTNGYRRTAGFDTSVEFGEEP